MPVHFPREAQYRGPLDYLMADSDSAIRVMIVGDDYLSTQKVERYLTAVGHDVVKIVKTADEAMASATLHHPDFIIMDASSRVHLME
jgi:AmiR/NasT family two-component response regulator